jgi:two-component system LytT family response regulator
LTAPPPSVSVLIADDEPVARAGLRAMLSAIDWAHCVGEAANGPAAVELINALHPDVVLLDIQMPGLIGTEVLQRVTHQPFVVFTTAYAEHAVTAFEVGAVDYLLKPFGVERFSAAMERVRAALGEPSATPALDRLREALSRGPMRRVFVRSGNAIIPLPVESVSRFEANGDYVIAHAGKARHWLHLSLNRLEGRLDPSKFLRIHRAWIVQLDAVAAFRRHGKGGMSAELTDGTRLPVSRARAQELRKLGV